MFRWFKFALPLVPLLAWGGLNLTSEEQAFLDAHPVVRTWYSYGSVAFESEENGRPTGFIIEYLRLVADTAGFEIDFGDSLHVWADTERGFLNGEIDILTGSVDTGRYNGYALFSKPYLYFHRVYVVRKDAPDVVSPYDLTGQTVSTVKNLPFVDVWRKKYPGIRFLMVDSDEETLRAVADGRADATFTFKSTYDYFVARAAFTNLRVGGVEKKAEGLENCFRVGIRGDWPELQSIINKAMDTIPQAQRKALWDEWFGTDGFNYAMLRKILISTGLVFLLVLVRYRMVARYNRQLRSLNHDLEKSLEERDRIMSVISHDLRQPLQGMAAFLDLLKEGAIDPTTEPGRTMVHQTRVHSEQVHESMENLLGWLNVRSNALHPRFEFLPARDVASDALMFLQTQIESKGIQIENRVHADVQVKADERMLETILRNLIANAVKFSNSGKTVAITAKRKENHWRIEIVDQGVGIESEQLGKIPSNRAESTLGTGGEKGAGLGLKLCSAFLKAMGSRLEITSEPGKGTTTCFELEAVEELS